MNHYIDCRERIEKEKLRLPAEIIKNGGIVIFPTETVYGIGTNGLKEEAVKKLYEIKQRPLYKPVSLLVSDMEMIESVATDITQEEYQLMQAFFPGPLTIVLKKKKEVPDIVTAGKDTVGIRMPEGKIAKQLIQYAGVPIATPSANISDKPSGTNLEMIMQDFKNKVDFWIDGGESKWGVASTIVQVINHKLCILRQGSLPKETIEEVFYS